MNQIPVSRKMDQLLESIRDTSQGPKKLLLHSCCAPCSSYVLEYLTPYFEIYDYFYNPNISSESEYQLRKEEMKRLIQEMPHENAIFMIEETFEPERFFQAVKGYEKCKEGGERCKICFELRLREAAKRCKELQCDYFATTLTISPLKNKDWINEIGNKIGTEEGVEYLPSDFKKKGGYLRSIELSKEYNLYRQSFCGCVFSKGERHEE